MIVSETVIIVRDPTFTGGRSDRLDSSLVLQMD